jgi:hypothetical protein
MANAHDRLDLMGIRRKQYGKRHDPEIGQAVALIGMKLFRRRNQPAGADDAAKLVKDRVVHQVAVVKHITPQSGKERSAVRMPIQDLMRR